MHTVLYKRALLYSATVLYQVQINTKPGIINTGTELAARARDRAVLGVYFYNLKLEDMNILVTRPPRKALFPHIIMQ